MVFEVGARGPYPRRDQAQPLPAQRRPQIHAVHVRLVGWIRERDAQRRVGQPLRIRLGGRALQLELRRLRWRQRPQVGLERPEVRDLHRQLAVARGFQQSLRAAAVERGQEIVHPHLALESGRLLPERVLHARVDAHLVDLARLELPREHHARRERRELHLFPVDLSVGRQVQPRLEICGRAQRVAEVDHERAVRAVLRRVGAAADALHLHRAHGAALLPPLDACRQLALHAVRRPVQPHREARVARQLLRRRDLVARAQVRIA